MNRSIAIIIIAIANIILLAHVVVPHHFEYTQEDFCSISIHKLSSNIDQCPHTDNQTVSKHTSKKKNHDFTFEDCQLEQIHIRLNKENHTLQTLDIDLSNTFAMVLSILNNLMPPKSISIERILIKYISPIYNFTPTNAIGLRAPPY